LSARRHNHRQPRPRPRPPLPQILLRSDPTFKPTSPVVWYGTSILQGGVASRPGQAFTNIISRGINQEILNFGFSGNGMMELSVAKFLTALPAAAFLIDCNWNMNGSLVAERVEPLVRYLRANGHPETPILLVEGTNAGASWFNTGVNASRQALRNALRQGYADLARSDKNLIYVEGDQFYNNAADNYTDPTVGGTHPSDLGMAAVANVYKKLLPPILAASSTAGKPFSPINYTAWAQTQASAEAGSHGVDAAMLAQHSASEEHRRAASLTADLKPAQPTVAQAWKGDEPVAFRDLMVGGRAFNATPSNLYYSRLPQAAEGVVRDAVWNLSLMSTGMYIRFVTNSTDATFTWALTGEAKPLWHMPNSGVSGLDLFAFDVTKQRWRHVGVPTTYDDTNTWSVALLEQGADVT
jgi:lysophospholipase L1-like esterase